MSGPSVLKINYSDIERTGCHAFQAPSTFFSNCGWFFFYFFLSCFILIGTFKNSKKKKNIEALMSWDLREVNLSSTITKTFETHQSCLTLPLTPKELCLRPSQLLIKWPVEELGTFASSTTNWPHMVTTKSALK
jgi:hypothetical protein